jgi:2-(1,2-epoxy-1,2-dihydrophenyl)acetyl-CoA isomerase
MELETILVKRDEAVGTIILNRPKSLNPLNNQCAREICAGIAELGADKNIRAVILTGAGNAFSAGGDIKEIKSSPPEEAMPFRDFMLVVKKVILDIRSLPKPVITAVNGLAYGVGFSLALAGDIILASDQATFCQVFVKIGLIPDGGSTYFLPRLIGFARAFPLVFSGDPIGAQEALNLGLISKVVPGDKLAEEAMGLAKKLAQGPTRAMGLAKELLYAGMERTLSDQLDEEASIQSLCRLTKDYQEGLQAFLEKRSPRFTGE